MVTLIVSLWASGFPDLPNCVYVIKACALRQAQISLSDRTRSRQQVHGRL